MPRLHAKFPRFSYVKHIDTGKVYSVDSCMIDVMSGRETYNCVEVDRIYPKEHKIDGSELVAVRRVTIWEEV